MPRIAAAEVVAPSQTVAAIPRVRGFPLHWIQPRFAVRSRLVKYAAKRTWPDRPKSWESKGEAESAEAFALAFAQEHGLGLGTELVVTELGSEDPDLRFFRVSNTAPYEMAQGEMRGAGPPATPSSPAPAMQPVEPESGDDEARPTMTMEHLRPFKSMIFYMLKVAFIAGAVIYALGLLFRYLRSVM
jgi:hypothetical protein